MHIHAIAANASGNALATAQSTESVLALRRARELRDAAAKLRAGPLDITPDAANDPQSVAMISAWSNGNTAGQASQAANQDSLTQRSSADADPAAFNALIQEVGSTPSSAPVSFWA